MPQLEAPKNRHSAQKLKQYRWALEVNFVARAHFMNPAISLLEANMRILVLSKPQYAQENEGGGEANQVEPMDTCSASQSRCYQAVEEWTMSSANTNDTCLGCDHPLKLIDDLQTIWCY